MEGNKILISLTLIILLLSLAGTAVAQVSPHFDAAWSRLASGGGERASTNYGTQDILGVWITEAPASNNFQIVTDFYWEGDELTTNQKLYLPNVNKP